MVVTSVSKVFQVGHVGGERIGHAVRVVVAVSLTSLMVSVRSVITLVECSQVGRQVRARRDATPACSPHCSQRAGRASSRMADPGRQRVRESDRLPRAGMPPSYRGPALSMGQYDPPNPASKDGREMAARSRSAWVIRVR